MGILSYVSYCVVGDEGSGTDTNDDDDYADDFESGENHLYLTQFIESRGIIHGVVFMVFPPTPLQQIKNIKLHIVTDIKLKM